MKEAKKSAAIYYSCFLIAVFFAPLFGATMGSQLAGSYESRLFTREEQFQLFIYWPAIGIALRMFLVFLSKCLPRLLNLMIEEFSLIDFDIRRQEWLERFGIWVKEILSSR